MRRIATIASISLLAFSLFAADKKKDPDEIGNRDVGKGVNFYSIEKEIALGKGLAQDVERQAKIIDDPVIAGLQRVGGLSVDAHPGVVVAQCRGCARAARRGNEESGCGGEPALHQCGSPSTTSSPTHRH
jgi:hypothetical protein